MTTAAAATSAADGGELLRAVGLAAGYHGHPVVSGIDLVVRRGEVVAVLGPNGAGKTTTLMALTGMLRPLAGEVHLNGVPTSRPVHRRAREGLAFVPEKRSVFMQLTVAENLRVGRVTAARAIEIFPELEPLMGRLAGKLSGGEQQMLTLARALGRDPRVLVADELSLGLAPLIVTRLLEVVRAVADERGVGVLLVEQHVDQALRYADRVHLLARGSVVRSGTPVEVAPHIQDAYIREADEDSRDDAPAG